MATPTQPVRIIGSIPVTVAGNVAVTEADGANVVLGTTTDAAVAGDNPGTIKAALRYIAKAIASFWDAVNNRINVYIQNASLAITGNVGTLPLTSGGCTIAHLVTAGGGDATNLKASAGQLYGVRVFNNAAYPIYVKFHNTAGVPTPGAGVVETVGVQAGVTVMAPVDSGAAYSTGIGLSVVKGITDASAVAVLANDAVVDDVYYK